MRTILIREQGWQDAVLETLSRKELLLYPTDTVYGLGCDATDAAAVEKVYTVKGREAKPVSVIAPSITWIRENCIVPAYAQAWLTKLPGPYTLVLRLREENAVAPSVHQGRGTLGVRIPAHPVSDVVAQFGKPVVTTSANRSGEPVIRALAEFPPALREHIALAVDGGTLLGEPSTVIDCTGEHAVPLRSSIVPHAPRERI